jgi:hypothetical protein
MIQAADIMAVSASAAEMLRARMARQVQDTGEVAGWHGRFTPGRIGAPGSAVPLKFFKEYGGLDEKVEGQVVQAILNAQCRDGDNDGGWRILSVSAVPSVEGTAPTLEGLIGASGNGLRDAISRGQTWLENACSPGGGWGSTVGNPPRVSITCASLLALTRLPAPDSAIINAATVWLVNTQRANGSWGPAPNESGTLTHTAMAVRGLIAGGLTADHPSINRAFDYIQRNWVPDPSAVQQESYDFHVGQAYHRVAAVYDVDAEVTLALINISRDGLGTKLWSAVSKWIARNDEGTWWERNDDMLSVWTVVPRALVCLRLARQFGPNATTVRWRNEVVVTSSSRGWWPLFRLCLSALQPSRNWQRYIVGFVCIAVGTSVVALELLGKLDTQTAVVGVLLPLALFVLQLPLPRRSK